MGTTWVFENPPSTTTVEVRSKMHANDNRVLREAALRGVGLAVLPRFLVNDDLKGGPLAGAHAEPSGGDLLDEGAGAAYQIEQAGGVGAR